MSATRVRVGNLLTMSTTHARVGNLLTVSTTRAHARARRMPQSGLGLQLGGIMPPACLGDSLGRRRAPRDASDAPRARGMPYFLLQWEERNERCPLVSGDCLCPPRVRGTPARARAGPRSGFPQVVRHPWGTRTRTLIYRTRTAHKGAIPPLCAAPYSLIPFLVCDTEKERGQDPRGTRRIGHSCCTA